MFPSLVFNSVEAVSAVSGAMSGDALTDGRGRDRRKRIFDLDHPQFTYSHKYRCNRLNIRTSQNHVRKFLFIIPPRRCTMYLYPVKSQIFTGIRTQITFQAADIVFGRGEP